jgi:hypothetical protein
MGRVQIVAAQQKTLFLLRKKPMTTEERVALAEKLYDTVTVVEEQFRIGPLVAGRQPQGMTFSKPVPKKERSRPNADKEKPTESAPQLPLPA